MQFLEVTFMIAGKYDANTLTSAIPLNSVRVGVGEDSDSVVWQYGTGWD